MKKKTNKRFMGSMGIVTMIIPAAAMISCGGNKNQKITSKFDTIPVFKGTKNNKKLGLIMTDPENPNWQKAKSMGEEQANNIFGNTLATIIKAAADQSTWISGNLAELDALIVGMTDDTVSSGWNNWKDNKKPVIAYDKLISVEGDSRKAYNWYVSFDNAKIGALEGAGIIAQLYNVPEISEMTDPTVIVAKLKEEGATKFDSAKLILALGGDPNDNNAPLFYKGAMSIIKAVMAWDTNLSIPTAFDTFAKVAQDGWNYQKGKSFLSTQISALKDDQKNSIVAVVSPNDGMANATILALKGAGLDPTKVVISGADANDQSLTSIKNNLGQNLTISKPSSLTTAIAIALSSYLVANPDLNNTPSAIASLPKKSGSDKSRLDELITAINVMFPTVDFIYDKTSYNTGSTPINALMLKPKPITSKNIDEIYSFSK